MSATVAKVEKARPVTPLGILVQDLEKIVGMVQASSEVPTEIATQIEKAYRLAAGIDPYIDECSTQESAALALVAKKTSEEPWSLRFSDGATVRALEQEMLSGHLEGQVLKMFIYMTKAKRVLDIGMFTGYSALAMAEALPDDGRVVACEVDAYVADFAQALFNQSPDGSKIQVVVAPALETLRKLDDAQESFDVVFIDADKKEYVQYFKMLLDTSLLAPDGFICVDNTLLQGQPYLPENERTANGEAIAQFNEAVKNDPRVEQVLLPVRDGLTIIRRV
jgi:caffeoyl-CoA O-methyltransferase